MAARRAVAEFSPRQLEPELAPVFASTLGALSPPHPLRLGRPVTDPAPPFAQPFERRSPRRPPQALDISLTRDDVEPAAAVLGQAPRAALRQGTVEGARRGCRTRSRARERGGEGSYKCLYSKELSFILAQHAPHHPAQRALHDLTRWRCPVRHAGDVRDDEHVEAVAVGMMRQ